jgi:hypothetical protein
LLAIGGRITDLINEHSPTEEQKAEGADWNPDTFRPALIAACAVDAGMTAEQWAEELADDRWSVADRNELFRLPLDANLRTADEDRRPGAAELGPLASLLR